VWLLLQRLRERRQGRGRLAPGALGASRLHGGELLGVLGALLLDHGVHHPLRERHLHEPALDLAGPGITLPALVVELDLHPRLLTERIHRRTLLPDHSATHHPRKQHRGAELLRLSHVVGGVALLQLLPEGRLRDNAGLERPTDDAQALLGTLLSGRHLHVAPRLRSGLLDPLAPLPDDHARQLARYHDLNAHLVRIPRGRVRVVGALALR